MTSKTIRVHSLLAPEALLDVMRRDGQLKHAQDLPVNLRSTGVNAVAFKVGKNASFRIDLDGVPMGTGSVDIVGRGRVTHAPGGGAEIALVIGGGLAARLHVLLLCGFCAYLVFSDWRAGHGLDGLAPVAFAFPFLWLIYWANLTRLVNRLEPGLMQLVERLAAGSLRASNAASSAHSG